MHGDAAAFCKDSTAAYPATCQSAYANFMLKLALIKGSTRVVTQQCLNNRLGVTPYLLAQHRFAKQHPMETIDEQRALKVENANPAKLHKPYDKYGKPDITQYEAGMLTSHISK